MLYQVDAAIRTPVSKPSWRHATTALTGDAAKLERHTGRQPPAHLASRTARPTVPLDGAIVAGAGAVTGAVPVPVLPSGAVEVAVAVELEDDGSAGDREGEALELEGGVCRGASRTGTSISQTKGSKGKVDTPRSSDVSAGASTASVGAAATAAPSEAVAVPATGSTTCPPGLQQGRTHSPKRTQQ